MLRRSLTAAATSLGCLLLLCQAAGAQQLEEYVNAAKASVGSFIRHSLLAISDEVIVQTISRADSRERVLEVILDPNLDPTSTPAWNKVLAWDGGRFLSSDSLLALWRSKKQLVASTVAALDAPARERIATRLAGVRRALDDYRMDRHGIRAAFREQRDAYALCLAKHGPNTQTLKDAIYRLGERAQELGDGLGELAFADRLWNAGGYQLLAVALTAATELNAEMNRDRPALQSSLPQNQAELVGNAVVQ